MTVFIKSTIDFSGKCKNTLDGADDWARGLCQ